MSLSSNPRPPTFAASIAEVTRLYRTLVTDLPAAADRATEDEDRLGLQLGAPSVAE